MVMNQSLVRLGYQGCETEKILDLLLALKEDCPQLLWECSNFSLLFFLRPIILNCIPLSHDPNYCLQGCETI